MKIVSILYHDIIKRGHPDASGFPGPAAGRYKLPMDEFDAHLEAIGARCRAVPIRIYDAFSTSREQPTYILTFDDGGKSAHTHIAGKLAERGWTGHFFVTTDFIGTPSFLNPAQIRDLRNQGHVIGTHSASHPMRMSQLTREQLIEEWTRSRNVLSEILAQQVITASVPGGYFSTAVAEAACAAGIRFLFTSEPVMSSCNIGDCMVMGRYGVWQGTAPRTVVGFINKRIGPRLKQYLFWNLKKMVKGLAGDAYLKARDAITRNQ